MRNSRFSLVLPLLLLLNACAPLTVLHDFRHTSVHCERYEDADRCYYLVTPDRAPNSPQVRLKRTHPPRIPGSSAIVFLHPALATAGMFEWLTGFAEAAVSEGHVVIYPEGVTRTWNDGRGGRTTVPEWLGLDDAGWLRKVIRDQQALGIQRIYLMGMSSGGMLAMQIFCSPNSMPAGSELGGLVTVVSNLPGSDVRDCQPQRAAPVMMIFGHKDWILQADGGEVLWMQALFGNTVSAGKSVATLVKALNCSVTTEERRYDQDQDGQAMVLRHYDDCAESAASVMAIRLEDASHIWPGEPAWTAWLTGRGPTTVEMDANRMILDWLRAPEAALP